MKIPPNKEDALLCLRNARDNLYRAMEIENYELTKYYAETIVLVVNQMNVNGWDKGM